MLSAVNLFTAEKYFIWISYIGYNFLFVQLWVNSLKVSNWLVKKCEKTIFWVKYI